MNPETLLAELESSQKRLAQTVALFSAEEFNRQPSETQWSPAQIAEHLLLLEKAAVLAISGKTVPTNRAPGNKLAVIKWVMEDETKREAPKIVSPSGESQNQEEIMNRLSAERDKLKTAIREKDLTEACMSFKHPGFGTLTRLEWLAFVIYHTERHRKQMEKLKSS